MQKLKALSYTQGDVNACGVCDCIKELPAPILDDIASHSPMEGRMQLGGPHASQDAMKIAWRYQNLPKVQVNTSAQIAMHFLTSVSYVMSCTSFVKDRVDLFLYFYIFFLNLLIPTPHVLPIMLA